jgi:O-antigen/teichoic acid export membrane protein
VSAGQRKAGAILSLVVLGVNALLALVYIPLLLKFLSVSDYGIYELGAAMISFLAMADMGLSAALSRAYAHREVSRPGTLPDLVATSVALYAVLTVLIASALGGLTQGVDEVFGATLSGAQLNATQQVVVLAAVNALVALPQAWINGLLTARERFVFLRLCSLARALLQFCLVLTVLWLGGGVVVAVGVQVVLTVLLLVVSLWYAWRRSDVELRFGSFQWSIARQLTAASSLLAIIVLFDLVFWRIGQFVLGAVRGAESIAMYALAVRVIVSVFLPLSVSLSSVFLPKLTHLHSSAGGGERTNQLFIQVGRMQAMMVWPAIGLFALLGRDAIRIWVGPEFVPMFAGILALMMSLSVSSTQSLGNQILQARNQLVFKAGLFAGMLLLYSCLALPVADRYGAQGLCFLGSAILAVGTIPIMNLYYSRRVSLDILRFFRSTAPLALPVLVALAVASLGRSLATEAWGRFGLLADAAIFAAIYVTLIWFVFLASSERDAVTRLARPRVTAG